MSPIPPSKSLTTPSSSPSSPVPAVFSSPELLCLILLQLDQQTLLTSAQRVCKAWSDQIHSAPVLQRHLFFRVPTLKPQHDGTQDAESRSDGGDVPQRVLNPLLTDRFPAWFEREAQVVDPNEFDEDAEMFRLLVAQGTDEWPGPEDSGDGDYSGEPSRRYSDGLWEDQMQRNRMYASCQTSSSPYLLSDASWLHMHVSDPPVTKIALYRSMGGFRWKQITATPLNYPEGLRMGEFYSIVLANTWGTSETPQFEIQWPPALKGTIDTRHVETAARQLGHANNPEFLETGNCWEEAGAMQADVLIMMARAQDCVIEPLVKTDKIFPEKKFFEKEFPDVFKQVGEIRWG